MRTALLLCLLPLVTLAQPNQPLTNTYPLEHRDGSVVAIQVVDAEGVSKEQLFDRARYWLATAYKAMPATVTLADKTGGVLLASATSTLQSGSLVFSNKGGQTTNLTYTMTIHTKEGRYRIELSAMRYDLPVRGRWRATRANFVQLHRDRMAASMEAIYQMATENRPAQETDAIYASADTSPVRGLVVSTVPLMENTRIHLNALLENFHAAMRQPVQARDDW